MLGLRIEITGTSPLVCHNIRLADPDDPIVREIKAITDKRRKTEEDRKAIAKLEWYGGLYTSPGIAGPTMPAANVRKCLIQAAKITRQGTQVQRALHLTDFHVAIAYDGPRDIDELFKNEAYHDRRAVGVTTSRTMRTRPIFQRWAVVVNGKLLDDVLDKDDLARIVEQAGLVEGLGDNRVNGYGRFEGRVVIG